MTVMNPVGSPATKILTRTASGSAFDNIESNFIPDFLAKSLQATNKEYLHIGYGAPPNTEYVWFLPNASPALAFGTWLLYNISSTAWVAATPALEIERLKRLLGLGAPVTPGTINNIPVIGYVEWQTNSLIGVTTDATYASRKKIDGNNVIANLQCRRVYVGSSPDPVYNEIALITLNSPLTTGSRIMVTTNQLVLSQSVAFIQIGASDPDFTSGTWAAGPNKIRVVGQNINDSPAYFAGSVLIESLAAAVTF